MSREIGFQDAAEILLRRACRRSVIIGEIEMRDAMIESAPAQSPGGFERRIVAEIMPEPEGYCGKVEPAAAASPIFHLCVSIPRHG
jgi:hypothetical protein